MSTSSDADGVATATGVQVFAAHAAKHLFDEMHDINIRASGDLRIEGYPFATVFSIWTTIEECLNPPLVWEKERGFFTLPPFAEPERFIFPEGAEPFDHRHARDRTRRWGTPRDLHVSNVRRPGNSGALRAAARRVAGGLNPVIAMELIATGVWHGSGVLSSESFDPDPYLAIMDREGIRYATIDIAPGGAFA